MSYQAFLCSGFRYWPYTVHFFISDLGPAGIANSLTKYADDFSLYVPEKTNITIGNEDDQPT